MSQSQQPPVGAVWDGSQWAMPAQPKPRTWWQENQNGCALMLILCVLCFGLLFGCLAVALPTP